MSVNVNGMNMNGNTTRIDGAVNYYGWLTYLIAYVPPADSIENVSVTTNDFTAEQGQAGGASIKITTKSGGHDFHGSAWEYYQDAAINARPIHDNAMTSDHRYGPQERVQRIRLQHRRPGLYSQDSDRQEEAVLLRQLGAHHAAPVDQRYCRRCRIANMIGGNFSELRR